MHIAFLCSQITAYPGQIINILIVSYDEQNFTTPDTVQIMGSNNDSVSCTVVLCVCIMYNCSYFRVY